MQYDFALLFNEILLIYFRMVFQFVQIILNPNPVFYHVRLFSGFV